MIAFFALRPVTDRLLKPAHDENNASDATGACNGIQPSVPDASSIEIRPTLRPVALPAVKLAHPASQQRDAFTIPLPLSPLLSPSHDGFMEGDFPSHDTLNKGLLIKFPASPEDDSKSHQVTEGHLPSLRAPSPKVSHSFMRPMQPLFLRNDSSDRILSRPGSPTPLSPPLSPQSRPTSPRFWKSACQSPVGWSTRPLSPSDYRFDGASSEHWGPMSCPTSPLLRPSNPLPSPTSPSASHALFSDVSRRLRALSPPSSVTPGTPVPSCSSPISWPSSPILQAFNVDNWVPERDPTEGIDVIEIMVTKVITQHVEYVE